jgi:hypothetical protein
MGRIVSCTAVATLLAGCATQQPQNAEEFRKVAPGAFLMASETLEVNRPLRDVGAAWQRRAPECLNASVRTTSQTSTSYQVITSTYKPTVVVGKDRAELHVQREFKGSGVITVGNPPQGGPYIIVADAYPLPGNRTRLQLIAPSKGQDVVIRAIKSWASGENLGCPDLTKQ